MPQEIYASREQLVIFDADGTTIDSFAVIGKAFAEHAMDLGDLARFQKRHKLFKYLGGLKEFPLNLRQQLSKQKRRELMNSLTEIYRAEAKLFPGMADLLRSLIAAPGVRVGLVTRNITEDPASTLRCVLARHDIDIRALDYWAHVPLGEAKTASFREARSRLKINPARSIVCGDEYKDYAAAIAAGLHPLIGAYGFDSLERLTEKYAVPPEVIAHTPEELIARLLHALDLPAASGMV